MGDSRHYNEGPRKQMTRTWKLCVAKALADNEEAGEEPSTIAALAVAIDADKAGLYRTLDPDGEQTASTYVDAICKELGIAEPLQEPVIPDDELERDLDQIRRLPKEKQDAVLAALRALGFLR